MDSHRRRTDPFSDRISRGLLGRQNTQSCLDRSSRAYPIRWFPHPHRSSIYPQYEGRRGAGKHNTHVHLCWSVKMNHSRRSSRRSRMVNGDPFRYRNLIS